VLTLIRRLHALAEKFAISSRRISGTSIRARFVHSEIADDDDGENHRRMLRTKASGGPSRTVFAVEMSMRRSVSRWCATRNCDTPRVAVQ